MSKLRLTLACRDYDITRPLLDGTVEPKGIELVPLQMDYHPERHWRMMQNAEFDVCEFSLYSYLILMEQGDFPYVAVPVFPYRLFHHSYLFVNRRGRVREPLDLNEGRIGLRNWQTKAGPATRGILQDQYGVDLHSIQWLLQDTEELDIPPLRSFRAERLTPDQSVDTMLTNREVDALILPSLPASFVKGHPDIVRLFANARKDEEAYFRETGIFPIIHTVVIRRSLLEQHPWVALNVVQAFEEAKQRAWQRMADPEAINLVWARESIEEQRAVFAGDPWPYGLPKNREAVDTVARYCHEQEITARRFTPEDLFFEASLVEPRWERRTITFPT